MYQVKPYSWGGQCPLLLSKLCHYVEKKMKDALDQMEEANTNMTVIPVVKAII